MSKRGPDSNNTNPDTKICCHCLQEKPIGLFSRHPCARKGRKQVCKLCDAAQGRKNHDERLLRLGKKRMVFVGGTVDSCEHKRGDVRGDGLVFHSKRNLKNGRFREWWMTKEAYELRNKKYRDIAALKYRTDPIHREKCRLKNTSDSQRAAKRKWNHSNRVHIQEYLAWRRAKIKSAQAGLSKEERKTARDFYAFRDILNHVHGKRMFEVDHIKPVARGGLHHPDNLRVTTAVFNHKKFVNQLCPKTHKKISA